MVPLDKWHHKSTSAGAYQIDEKTYDDSVKHHVAHDSKQSQDAIAVWPISHRGAAQWDIWDGDLDLVVRMKRVLLVACLAAFCRPQAVYARSPQVELHKASLICGGTRFSVRSELIRSAPVSQVMTAREGSTKSVVPVDLRQTRVSYPFELGATKGLASMVSAWQCRKTPAGHVLVLWYYCPQTLREDVPAAMCSVTSEWERYVALDGSLLDRGFSIDDVRYDALRAKLGYHNKPDQAFDEGPFIWFLH